jgi:hypothetical protein
VHDARNSNYQAPSRYRRERRKAELKQLDKVWSAGERLSLETQAETAIDMFGSAEAVKLTTYWFDPATGSIRRMGRLKSACECCEPSWPS